MRQVHDPVSDGQHPKSDQSGDETINTPATTNPGLKPQPPTRTVPQPSAKDILRGHLR
jgi:hypothetical protein